MSTKSIFLAFSLLLGMWGAGLAQDAADAVAPESGEFSNPMNFAAETALSRKYKSEGRPVKGKTWMISAANPYAAEAGANTLAVGGSAADAMVVVQLILGLVEPQSSGLGGGAFAVWYDAATGKVTTYDGRETAPMAATPKLFQDENGEPLKFFDAVVGGRSVGTPGTPKLLEVVHKKHGKRRWDGLFDRAIQLAEGGFIVSPRLAGLVANDAERLDRFLPTADYFLQGDRSGLKAGKELSNFAYASTLKAMRDGGVKVLYEGKLAEAIVKTVNEAPGNPGVLSMEDLASYEVKEREPVCVMYRVYNVCGMGPPSSGALTVGQILKLLEPYNLAEQPPFGLRSLRLIGDASRLAFADRGRYMADSDFVKMPTKGLVADDYLLERSKLLDREDALENVVPGEPKFDHAMLYGDDESLELPSTSHISIIDSYGNALSMTTTIENGFGSRLFVNGYLLNNELTDFSFRDEKDGVPIANRVEPGKRPRSSMAPTIVLKDGKPVMVIGSPGGSRIIGYVAKAIIAHLDWGMDIQSAIDAPHYVNRFGTFDIEQGRAPQTMQAQLEALGFEVKVRDLNSGLHGIVVTNEGLEGGADRRREGIARGDD